jgi:hypothetical protein
MSIESLNFIEQEVVEVRQNFAQRRVRDSPMKFWRP